MAPDIIFSEKYISQISSHFNQIHGLRDLEILVPEYLRARTIMTPDTIFSGYEISLDVNKIHDPGELEFIVHQNT